MKELLQELGWDEDRLQPDKYRLDTEFERHPQDIATVCERLADARHARAQAQQQKAFMEYEARRAITVEWGTTKYTVGDLTAAIEQAAGVKRALRDTLMGDRDVEMWTGLLKALEAKTSALKHLSELWQAGYYVTTSSHEPPTRARRGRAD